MSGIRLADLSPRDQAKVRAQLERVADVGRAPTRPLAAPFAGAIVIGNPPVARRTGDTLWLRLAVAPRTKKNHGRGVAKESAAYARFAFHVKDLVEPMREALGLPLPDRRYNCAASFHVDNDRADTVGLMQGLADALESAVVVTNDRQLWAWDGTTQVVAPLRPYVELTLTPLGP